MQTPPAARVFNPLYRDRLFALIDAAPFVRHMGMRITDLAWGSATFEMTAAQSRDRRGSGCPCRLHQAFAGAEPTEMV